jgi:hypothetical protein
MSKIVTTLLPRQQSQIALAACSGNRNWPPIRPEFLNEIGMLRFINGTRDHLIIFALNYRNASDCSVN